MGLCAAYTAFENGHNVTIFDPDGFPAQNSASHMAGGMLAPYGEIEHMDMDWVHMGVRAIDLWGDITTAIGAAHLLTRAGSLMIAHPNDEHMLTRFAGHLPADEKGDTWEHIRPHAHAPALCDKFKRGVRLSTEAHVHPQDLMRALCTHLKRTDTARFIAEKFDETKRGAFDNVIYCHGMGAARTVKNLRGVKGEILYVRNPQFTAPCPIRLMHPRYPLYIVPRDDHVFMIGATTIEGADNAVSLRSSMELMSALYTLHPSFGDAQVLDFKAGVRPTYTDNLPHITYADNALQCNGLFRHGYLLAPIVARCVVAMINNEDDAPYASLLVKP